MGYHDEDCGTVFLVTLCLFVFRCRRSGQPFDSSLPLPNRSNNDSSFALIYIYICICMPPNSIYRSTAVDGEAAAPLFAVLLLLLLLLMLLIMLMLLLFVREKRERDTHTRDDIENGGECGQTIYFLFVG